MAKPWPVCWLSFSSMACENRDMRRKSWQAKGMAKKTTCLREALALTLWHVCLQEGRSCRKEGIYNFLEAGRNRKWEAGAVCLEEAGALDVNATLFSLTA